MSGLVLFPTFRAEASRVPMLGLPAGLWLLDLQWDDAEVVGTISRRKAKMGWEQSI